PGLSDGHLPAKRLPRFHESGSGIFARFENTRESARLAGENADARGTLPIARVRSGGRIVDWLSLLMRVIPSEAEESRCGCLRVTPRDPSIRADWYFRSG